MSDPHDHHHDHHHDHEHTHHHDHGHAHDHADGNLTETQKIAKLLQHWIKHNDDHATNYTEWAQKADALGLTVTAERLRAAADLTQAVSREFAAAADAIHD